MDAYDLDDDNDSGDTGADVHASLRPLAEALIGSRLRLRVPLTAALLVLPAIAGAFAWTHRAPPPVEAPPVTQVALFASEPAAVEAAAAPVAPVASPRRHRAASERVASPRAEREARPEHEESAAPAEPATPTGEPPRSEEATPTDSVDSVVERAVSEHYAAIEQCIQHAEDAAEGRVVLHIVIAPDGTVRSARPSSPPALREVGECIAHEARTWSLAVPDASDDSSISWPFEVESNVD